MKTLTAFATALISAAILFSAAPASAQEVTRAQVLAELAQARDNGEVPNYGADFGYSPLQARQAAKSRAEVRAELKGARKDGTLEAMNADLATPAKTQADTRLATTPNLPAKTVTTAE